MTETPFTADLEGLRSSITGMQKSARRTLPMFALGILATLLAAGIAIYYIVTLSADLREARAALRESQNALTEARLNLARIGTSLRQTQASASETTASAESLAQAIDEVAVSQRDLSSASSSLAQATARLPAPEKAASLTGRWTDEHGTVYQIRQSGSSFGYQAAFRQAPGSGSRPVFGTATGTVSGDALTYSYQDTLGNTYRCSATVSRDRQSIEETCRTRGNQELRVTLIRS